MDKDSLTIIYLAAGITESWKKGGMMAMIEWPLQENVMVLPPQ